MQSKSTSRLSVDNRHSKQPTIFSAMKNWKMLEKQQNMKKKFNKMFNTGVLIDLTELDSDSDRETQDVTPEASYPPVIVKSEFSDRVSVMIGVNKPNASSTPLKSQNSLQISTVSADDDESSGSTITYDDSEEAANVDNTSTQRKIVINQNILITSSNGMQNVSVVDGHTDLGENNSEMVEPNGQRQEEIDINKTMQSGSGKADESFSSASKIPPDKSLIISVQRDPELAQSSKIKANLMSPDKLASFLDGKSKAKQVQGNSNNTMTTVRSPTKRKADFSFSSPSKKNPMQEPPTVKSPKKENAETMNKNYLIVINGLIENVYRSQHLRSLVETEKPVLTLIANADPKYFFVCLKLYIWQPKWYNVFTFCDKIHVGLEEKEIIQLYEFLKHNNIVYTNVCKDELATILKDLNIIQLKTICEKFKVLKALPSKHQMKKEDLVQCLLKYCNTQSTLLAKSSKDLLMEEVKCQMGYCVKLNDTFREAFYNIYVLGTFTNPAFSDIGDFFNNMLHHQIVFPKYHVEDYAIFYSKNEFASYIKARKLREAIEETLKSKNHLALLQQSRKTFQQLKELKRNNANEEHDRYKDVPHLKKFTAESVYVSTLSKVAEPLTTKFPDQVRQWLKYLIRNFPSSHRLGNWYYQLTWLYMRHLQPNDNERAAKLLTEVLQSDQSNLTDVQLHEIGRRGQQLRAGAKPKINSLHQNIIAELTPETINPADFPTNVVDATAIRSCEKGKKRNYVVRGTDGDKSYTSVENIALSHYIDRCGYTDGKHCEGSLVTASFALLFWDVIYDPEKVVPGTFLSKNQSVPLDMYTPYFYANRKDAIDCRLDEIRSGWRDEQLVEFAKKNQQLHSNEHGLCRAGVIEDPEIWRVMVDCVGREVLAKIYERLVKNFGQYRSGMPDLLVWNVENKKSKFVEVKGENDTLSIKQKLWLKYLMSIGANVEVCQVHSMGSKRKLKIDGRKVGKLEQREGSDKECTPKSDKKIRKPRANKKKDEDKNELSKEVGEHSKQKSNH